MFILSGIVNRANSTLALVTNVSMKRLTARILDTPSLRYLYLPDKGHNWTPRDTQRMTRRMVNGERRRYLERSVETSATGTRSIVEDRFLIVPKAPRCAWVYLRKTNTLRNHAAWQDLIRKALAEYCTTEDEEPALHPLGNSSDRAQRQLSTTSAVADVARILTEANSAGFDLLFVLLDGGDAADYELVKYLADTQVGIHTVCTVANNGTLKTGWRYAANVMLKVNLKMGGINTALMAPKNSLVEILLGPTTMIVGADVTHPGPGSMKDTDSIAAVVATYEETFSHYPASIRCQQSKQEMIEHIGPMFRERLDMWVRKREDNALLPERILFFRDGVSEEQFRTVAEIELPKIEQVLKDVYIPRGQNLPKVQVICVVKRVHTRFYAKPNTTDFVDRTGNFNPGLVVDHTVVRPRGNDFYMQSQIALQGTAKPTHYVMISNTGDVPGAALQMAIFGHCWTFPTSLAPISVHPAARMADKACGRARAYLRAFFVAGAGADDTMDRRPGGNAEHAWNSVIHERLKDTTFYI
jgi:hypothetical protein